MSRSLAPYASLASLLLSPALAHAGCVAGQLVWSLPIRHTDATRAPAFLNSMTPENRAWVAETVRVPHAQYEWLAGRPGDFRDYLLGYLEGTRGFDKSFRSGSVSGKLRRVLKRQHRTMVLGPEEKLRYSGTTAPSGTRLPAGRFVSETENAASSATIDLKRPSDWRTEGPDPTPPPPGLPGPFPEDGQSWRLWFPEIVDSAQAKGLDLDEVLPRNFNEGGVIRHRYPAFAHQSLYIDRMAALMKQIEDRLLRTHPATPLGDVLDVIADYYQVGINAHLFLRVNNSLLMSQVNYLLRYMGLNGIPHGSLDYLALYRIPQDFREAFVAAVRAKNPGI